VASLIAEIGIVLSPLARTGQEAELSSTGRSQSQEQQPLGNQEELKKTAQRLLKTIKKDNVPLDKRIEAVSKAVALLRQDEFVPLLLDELLVQAVRLKIPRKTGSVSQPERDGDNIQVRQSISKELKNALMGDSSLSDKLYEVIKTRLSPAVDRSNIRGYFGVIYDFLKDKNVRPNSAQSESLGNAMALILQFIALPNEKHMEIVNLLRQKGCAEQYDAMARDATARWINIRWKMWIGSFKSGEKSLCIDQAIVARMGGEEKTVRLASKWHRRIRVTTDPTTGDLSFRKMSGGKNIAIEPEASPTAQGKLPQSGQKGMSLSVKGSRENRGYYPDPEDIDGKDEMFWDPITNNPILPAHQRERLPHKLKLALRSIPIFGGFEFYSRRHRLSGGGGSGSRQVTA
jgi:hypothetical protein